PPAPPPPPSSPTRRSSDLAVAWHRRRNLPERRDRMSAAANFHSVKNRFLLRINNQSVSELVRTLGPTLARDLVVVGACLTTRSRDRKSTRLNSSHGSISYA